MKQGNSKNENSTSKEFELEGMQFKEVSFETKKKGKTNKPL